MELLVIGGGPAGLRAAEVAAEGGASVCLYDGQASVGRKFLIAGRGGLNLTKDEPPEIFTSRYDAPEQWRDLIAEFGPAALRDWAHRLGVETFAASTGRVYPEGLKAAPLLRRWVRRLRELNVGFAMRHRWAGLSLEEGGFWAAFQVAASDSSSGSTGDGLFRVRGDAVVLALGGGSWPQTGSDGSWVEIMDRLGVQVARLEPSNCGWECAWPPEVLAAAEGKPLKNVAVSAGGRSCKGELLVTNYGLEGGALYSLSPVLRRMQRPRITIDFKPSQTVEQLTGKIGHVGKNLMNEAAVHWRLPAAVRAIIEHCASATDAVALAIQAKNFTLTLDRPRPLAEAISTAGGVRWNELDSRLMIRKLPGVFVAGEMIDWEAPTGGYLLQGCFATGTRAGLGAMKWMSETRSSGHQESVRNGEAGSPSLL